MPVQPDTFIMVCLGFKTNIYASPCSSHPQGHFNNTWTILTRRELAKASYYVSIIQARFVMFKDRSFSPITPKQTQLLETIVFF